MEGETPVAKFVEGETHVSKNVEGETPSLYIERGTTFDFEGATPTLFAEGETPIVSEGEIPNKPKEETPNKSTGENPIMCAEGEIPGNSGGDEIPVTASGQRPKEDGPLEVVDLDTVPEDSPVNLRESRRMARRSFLDEVDEGDRDRGSGFLAPGATSVRNS